MLQNSYKFCVVLHLKIKCKQNSSNNESEVKARERSDYNYCSRGLNTIVKTFVATNLGIILLHLLLLYLAAITKKNPLSRTLHTEQLDINGILERYNNILTWWDIISAVLHKFYYECFFSSVSILVVFYSINPFHREDTIRTNQNKRHQHSKCLIYLLRPTLFHLYISLTELRMILILSCQSPRWQCSAGRTCLWRRGVWSTWRARWPGPRRPRPQPPGATTTASSHSGGPDPGSPSSSTRARSPPRSSSSCPPGQRSWWSPS